MLVRTVGVEEEFLLVNPETGRPVALAGAVLRSADEPDGETEELTGELQNEQIETGTRPVRTLTELGKELRTARAAAREAAGAVGVAVAALATSPLAVEPSVSPTPRYRALAERFGMTVDEQLTCGCHVHVAVDGDEEGVAVLDRIRPWLAPLLAVTGNSPFWQGRDSGYASFRGEVWQRWPSAGGYQTFGSAAGYRAVVDEMLGTGTILDEAMLYLDARLSAQHPTVEIRVADVCLDPDDAVLLAALVRALVETASRDWRAGVPADDVRTEVLRLASWRAARSGVEEDLLLPGAWRPAPAAEVLDALVGHVREALEDAGDLDDVRVLLGAVLDRGTGSRMQREVAGHEGDLAAVVAEAARRT
jgi:carboxylate-amine ligase